MTPPQSNTKTDIFRVAVEDAANESGTLVLQIGKLPIVKSAFTLPTSGAGAINIDVSKAIQTLVRKAPHHVVVAIERLIVANKTSARS